MDHYTVSDYGQMVADPVRMSAYTRAISQRVRAGGVVSISVLGLASSPCWLAKRGRDLSLRLSRTRRLVSSQRPWRSVAIVMSSVVSRRFHRRFLFRNGQTSSFRICLGIGRPLANRILKYDGLGTQFRIVPIRRSAKCPLCGDAPTITALTLQETPVCDLSSAPQAVGG